jgi:restriction system protein
VFEPKDRYDRLVLWIVKNVPGRGVLVLAGISYLGFGLALPLALGWPALWLFDANLFGTIFAASLLFGWLFVQIEARDRRHLVEWTTDLRSLDAREFEWLVGELYRREGWEVTERGRQGGPDGNIDLEIHRASERRIIQAKRWESWQVGVDLVRAFGGTLLREGLQGRDGIFVTLSTFTPQAVEEAKTSAIELVDGGDLYRRVEKVRRPVICDKCDQPMRFDRSIHGWWYRCITHGCEGKLDLSAEPGRAVALLNESR